MNISESVVSEAETPVDDRRKSEQEVEDVERAMRLKKPRNKEILKRDRVHGNVIGKFEALANGFREEACGRVDDMKRERVGQGEKEKQYNFQGHKSGHSKGRERD